MDRCKSIVSGVILFSTLLATHHAFGQESIKPKAEPENRQTVDVDPHFIRQKLKEWRENQKVRGALSDTTSLEFIQAPLADVTSFLEDLHGIQIHLDTRSLKDADLHNDTPITVELRGIALNQALRLMLKEHDMTYVVEGGMILITSSKEASQRTSTHVFAIGDLIDNADEKQELVAAVQVVITEDSARVVIYREFVIVHGSYQQSVKVEELLNLLRKDPQAGLRSSNHPLDIWPIGRHAAFGGALDQGDIHRLSRHKQIEVLDVSNNDLGDAELKLIANELPRITSLSLSRTGVTDAGLVHLKRMTDLRHIDLVDTQITNASLKLLAECQSLALVQIGSTRRDHAKITESAVEELQRALPNCMIKALFHQPRPRVRPSADPFGGGADPFGGGGRGADPFGPADPFGGGVKGDPFR